MSARSLLFYMQRRAFSKVTPPRSVVEAYNEKVSTKQIRDDPYQRLAVQNFDELRTELIQEHSAWKEYAAGLKNYVEYKSHKTHPPKQAPKEESKGLFGSFFGGGAPAAAPVHTQKQHKPAFRGKKLKGLYLYGGPGCGKTFTMDMFADMVPFEEKQRIHFNEFMLKVHQDLHKIDHRVYDNPLTLVAQNIASKVRLLCFDEFQVTDIGDALIMKNLFQSLFLNNVVLVATSNRPPDDLYYQGLQRHLFVPFIDILKSECKVINMNSPTDYRLTFETEDQLKHSTFLEPNDNENNKKIERIFNTLAKQPGQNTKVTVMSGREIDVPKAANGVAIFDFLDLCDKPFGSMDFIAICRSFHSLLLKNVPVIGLENKNLARRFILLVDELYNHKVKLYVSATKPLTELFKITFEDGPSDEMFALDRAKSRLIEMQSHKYMEEPSYYNMKHTGEGILRESSAQAP